MTGKALQRKDAEDLFRDTRETMKELSERQERAINAFSERHERSMDKLSEAIGRIADATVTLNHNSTRVGDLVDQMKQSEENKTTVNSTRETVKDILKYVVAPLISAVSILAGVKVLGI